MNGMYADPKYDDLTESRAAAYAIEISTNICRSDKDYSEGAANLCI
jgi:hypothetical protein